MIEATSTKQKCGKPGDTLLILGWCPPSISGEIGDGLLFGGQVDRAFLGMVEYWPYSWD